MPYTNSFDPDFGKCLQCIATNRMWYSINPPAAHSSIACSDSTSTAFDSNLMEFVLFNGI